MIEITISSVTVDVFGPEEVYEFIAEYLCPDISAIPEEMHMIAADAAGWAEIACVDEIYQDGRLPELTMTIIDSQ